MINLKKHSGAIRKIKMVIAALLGVMVLIDVVLVAMEKYGYPTFSWVVRDNRTTLVWLTFLFGGLIAKVFYNRTVKTATSETKGFMVFFTMVVILAVIGRSCVIPMDTFGEFMMLIAGGLFAHGVWPQYRVLPTDDPSGESV